MFYQSFGVQTVLTEIRATALCIMICREESPGFTEIWCRVIPGGRGPTESAAEKIQPMAYLVSTGYGEMVR